MPRPRLSRIVLLTMVAQLILLRAVYAQGSLGAVVDKIKADTTVQSKPGPRQEAPAPAGLDWRSAPADQLTLGQTRELDKADHIGGMAIPSTGDRIYYGKTFGGKSFVVLRDLNNGKVLSSFQVPDRVQALTLSPSGDRLLVCFGFGGKTALVRDLANQRSIDLTITLSACASEDKPLTWVDDTTVIYDGNVLDLDTLQDRRAPDYPYPPIKGKEFGTHPNAYYERVDYTGLAICDRHSDYCHQMFPSMERWISTPDMRHVVMIDFCNGCGPDYRLVSWSLGTRAAPVRELSVNLPSTIGGESWDKQRSSERFEECVSNGIGFYGRVSGPKINPLNGKLVAADGSDKGTVRLDPVPGTDVRRAVVVLEKLPIRAGDVIDLVWSADDCRGDRSYRASDLFLPMNPVVAQ